MVSAASGVASISAGGGRVTAPRSGSRSATGVRLFDHAAAGPVELERIRIVDPANVNHLRFRAPGNADRAERLIWVCC
jgi:hypothetical protein